MRNTAKICAFAGTSAYPSLRKDSNPDTQKNFFIIVWNIVWKTMNTINSSHGQGILLFILWTLSFSLYIFLFVVNIHISWLFQANFSNLVFELCIGSPPLGDTWLFFSGRLHNRAPLWSLCWSNSHKLSILTARELHNEHNCEPLKDVEHKNWDDIVYIQIVYMFLCNSVKILSPSSAHELI